MPKDTLPPKVQGLFNYFPEAQSIRLMISGREVSIRKGQDVWQVLRDIANGFLPPLPEVKEPVKCAYCHQPVAKCHCVEERAQAKRVETARPMSEAEIDAAFEGIDLEELFK